MENSIELSSFGSHEVKFVDRAIINLSGISKIISFDDQEFLLESNMGTILLKGEGLEVVKLDTHEGHVKIKGKIISFAYIDNIKKQNSENIFSKLFK